MNQMNQMEQIKLKPFFAEAEPRFGVVLAYLFGSRSENCFGPLSDYDLAVLFSGDPPGRDKYHLAHLLGVLLGTTEVDLVWIGNSLVPQN